MATIKLLGNSISFFFLDTVRIDGIVVYIKISHQPAKKHLQTTSDRIICFVCLIHGNKRIEFNNKDNKDNSDKKNKKTT